MTNEELVKEIGLLEEKILGKVYRHSELFDEVGEDVDKLHDLYRELANGNDEIYAEGAKTKEKKLYRILASKYFHLKEEAESRSRTYTSMGNY